MAVVIELDVEIPDLASVEVETPDTEITPSSGETVLLVITPGPPGEQGDRGPAGDGAQVFGEILTGADGVTVTFTLANSYAPDTTAVYLNGLREVPGDAYSESGVNTITFDDPPLSTDAIRVDYLIA